MMKKKQVSAENAIERLEELCARSEQCTVDVRTKLFRWGVAQADADRVVERLTDTGFVDDARFARAYVRDKYRFSAWGRVKISSSLRLKRIPQDTIAEAMKEIDLRLYAATAMRTLRSKLRSLRDKGYDDYELRRRLYAFGIGRGYESVLVGKILNSRTLWISEE